MANDEFVLEPNQVHIWEIDLQCKPAELGALERLLSADELSRADRFVTEDLRRRFIVARGSLRLLLGRATSTDASDICFRYEQWGKPQIDSKRLSNPGNIDGKATDHLDTTSILGHRAASTDLSGLGPVQFSVTHSGDLALIALSQHPLGVDLELPDRRLSARAIASQVISDGEQAAWDKMTAAVQTNEILRLWVCKEALLKAMGLGIAEGLKKISFPMPIPDANVRFSPTFIDAGLQLHLEEDATCSRNAWLEKAFWQLEMSAEVDGAVVAIAMPRNVQNVQLHGDYARR